MLSSDFLFPRFFVVPLANPSNFSHCKCFSSRIVSMGRLSFVKLLFIRIGREDLNQKQEEYPMAISWT